MTRIAHPHRRFNPLLREWVLVSPHRTDRPWQGQVERPPRDATPAYEPACYLCPGNARAGGVHNPPYTGTFVFDNDFAALRADTPADDINEADLLVAAAEPGRCRVVCFSPRHDLTLATMAAADVRAVVDTWVEEYVGLGARPGIGYVQIFENRGEMMGASNPHPHGQIWATQTIPDLPSREQASLAEYRRAHGTCLLCDYLALERDRGDRVVCENDAFTALVPFWAVWPFELMLLSRRHVSALDELDSAERDALADILREATTRYDNLFETPFPYSMGFHQRPTDGSSHPEHLHAHFLPPLLRSATIRKFMVGFELLGMPQRDVTPEDAAQRLRAAGREHYSRR
jgi:UDPglucose--hexose-1-phosphate uridylyltransferase